MGEHGYYMLMASLPALPRFDRAERVPINRERLYSRRNMLRPDDVELVERADAFFGWFHPFATRSEKQIVTHYETMAKTVEMRGLWHVFELPVNLRTILAALRVRREDADGGGDRLSKGLWGVGPLAYHIRRHWGVPDFKLSARYPWVERIRSYLEKGAAFDLEHFTFELVWERFDRFVPENPFGIEAFLAYLFKWSMVQQWLSHDQMRALQRFKDLVAAVIHGWEEDVNGN